MTRLLATSIALLVLAVWSVIGYPLPGAVAMSTGGPTDPRVAGISHVSIQLAPPIDPAIMAQVASGQIDRTIQDPWDKGSVLSYLFFTMNPEEQADAARFVSKFGFSAVDVAALRALAAETQTKLKALSRPTKEQVYSIGGDQDARFHALVGTKYAEARAWLKDWYAKDITIRELQQRSQNKKSKSEVQPASAIAARLGAVAAAASYDNVFVYGTQFNSSGWDIAMPDWGLKCGTLGLTGCPTHYLSGDTFPPPYQGPTYYAGSGIWQSPWVKEVGPWNEQDNYWDSAAAGTYNQRRCNPSPGQANDGVPEAQLALNNGFNGGYSCYEKDGVTQQYVTNPAGVDLEPDLAAGFGLCRNVCNAWFSVTTTTFP